MKNVVHVDYQELVRILRGITNTAPATFVAVTLVDMNKTYGDKGDKKANPYFERVTKKQKSNVFINYDYTNAVNKRLLKEGKSPDFVAKPRTWGERIEGTSLIFHKNEYYLNAGFITNNTPKVEYMLDKKPTDLYLKNICRINLHHPDTKVWMRK